MEQTADAQLAQWLEWWPDEALPAIGAATGLCCEPGPAATADPLQLLGHELCVDPPVIELPEGHALKEEEQQDAQQQQRRQEQQQHMSSKQQQQPGLLGGIPIQVSC